MKTKKITFIISAALLIVFGLTALKQDDRSFNISKYLNIFASVFREVNMLYVDEIDPEKLITEGIYAMLKTLDPYTVYFPESEMEDVKLMTTGEYAGIGSIIGKKGDHVIIREPYRNSPADKAGLLPGDIILAVDGISAEGKEIEEVSNMLKGLPGKELVIKVKRELQDKPLEIKAIREKIQLPSVPFYGIINDSIGYLFLSNFTDKSAQDVRKAIIDLKNRGAISMILDLRGNSGGLLDQAVEIINYFVPRDIEIVSTKGKIKQLDREFRTTKNPILPKMPLAVLIDRASASAAEIVSGALQDFDRAVLIGERSFGKGLVQNVRDLPYNTKLKVTTAKYYIPSGRCIQAVDYSHRNPDGSVGKIPDSLINEYTTKNGRKVYDGGGITPDITIEAETFARITQELVLQDLTFDFVNSYALKYPEVASLQEFKLTDDIYNQFKQYLKDKKFSYETESQKFLERLVRTTKQEKYYEESKSKIKELEKIFTHSIDRDMNLFKDEITTFLTEQFIQRYYFSEGVIEYRIGYDKDIKKAIQILTDQKGYQSILAGTNKEE